MKNLLALLLTVTVSLTAALQPLRAETPPAPPAGKTQHLTSPDEVPEGLAKSDWASIRAAYEAGRHAFAPTESGWRARNPGQQWITTFDKRGFVAEPGHGEWTWGLELKGYGFAGAERTVGGVPTVRAEGQRLTYGWDTTVQEWFVNDTRGLEHGFTVTERPDGSEGQETSAPLRFTLAVRGSLTARVATDGRDVAFRNAAGATVLTYAGLKVWDADGKELAARFAPEENSSPGTLRLEVEESGARYPLTIDPLAQQAYLKASNTGNSDNFGESVAVSGDTVVVGAPGEESIATGVNGDQTDDSISTAGAAYVFTRSGTAWAQQAYLKASNTGNSDNFGASVAVSGDTVVVGARFEASNATGVNAPVSGGTGTQEDDSVTDSGAAYVFTRSGTAWTQEAYLKASNAGDSDLFGFSVAVSGDTVVVGAFGEDSNATGVNGDQANNSAGESGAAYVFTRSGTTWTQQAYLKASNTEADDEFGNSVAVSGDTVVVGADEEDSNATGVNGDETNNSAGDSGAAYVFTRSGTAWTQQAYLKASNTEANDEFGQSVAVSGDTVVVGAFAEDSNATGVDGDQADNSAFTSGAAYIFTRSGTTWSQQAYLKASNTGPNDRFGDSVAVSGDTVVVGALFEASNATGVNGDQADNSAGNSGAAYVFTRSGATWTQQAYLKASNTGASDRFGGSVAVSGDTVFVGAFREDSAATGVNGNQADNSAGFAGAAYVFIVEMTTLNPVSNTIGSAGGSYDITVTSNTDWTAASDMPFATVSPAGGTGNGTVTVTVATNTGGARTAMLTIGGNSHVLTQDVPNGSDLNNDGFTDLVFQDPGGEVAFLFLKGTAAFTPSDVQTIFSGAETMGYEAVAAADLVGFGTGNQSDRPDGHADIVFQGPGGDVVVVEFKGTSSVNSITEIASGAEAAGYTVGAAGDVLGTVGSGNALVPDGFGDLIFQGPGGDVVVLELRGTTSFNAASDVTTVVASEENPMGYSVAGAADFTGIGSSNDPMQSAPDGFGDVVFQGPGGDVVVLAMRGAVASPISTNAVKTFFTSEQTSGYVVRGAGDIVGLGTGGQPDGFADMIFQGPGGDVVILELKGSNAFDNPGSVKVLTPDAQGFVPTLR